MKLISDLKVGDKIFVIDKSNWTFDIAEVICVLDTMIKLQFYLSNVTDYIWRYQESRHVSAWYTFFTDENEALQEFKFILNYNQNGRNR